MAMKTMIRPQPLVVLVMLYGILGARFGRVHHLAVSSPSEAVHALCVKVPGFKRFLRFSEERGLSYAIFRGKKNLNESEMEMRQDTAEPIRIAPIVIGAGYVLIQMASIVKECALGHSKHRIQRPCRSWSSPSLK